MIFDTVSVATPHPVISCANTLSTHYDFWTGVRILVKGGLELSVQESKKLITSECLENVLTRKSYSTPVYLINIFEIGPVVLELGHFKDGVPKNEKSKKSKMT